METKKILELADLKFQYDETAKTLVCNKDILAHILKYTIDEFKEMPPDKILQHIEGEPQISQVFLDPGMTNSSQTNAGKAASTTPNVEGIPSTTRIIGNNTEHYEINEGLIRFDIVFYVRMRNGLSQMIINIEIQKDQPTTYGILNRAIFYVSRLISSQKERDFIHSNYDDIKQVYSIWICMNMKEDSLNHISLNNEYLYGNTSWNGNLDLMNIILIGLANREHADASADNTRLHQLLGTIFSDKLSIQRKTQVLKDNFQLNIDSEIRRELNSMCNLSDAIEERGIRKGIQQGHASGVISGVNHTILQFYQGGMNISQIAAILKRPEKEIEEIVKG